MLTCRDACQVIQIVKDLTNDQSAWLDDLNYDSFKHALIVSSIIYLLYLYSVYLSVYFRW